MANIITLVALCAVFGVGLINAFVANDVPRGFLDNNKAYLLSPVKVEVQGNRKVFKFGNEQARKYFVDFSSTDLTRNFIAVH